MFWTSILDCLKSVFCKLYVLLYIGPKYLIIEHLLYRHKSTKIPEFKHKKTVLITGGSKGVGLGAVKILSKLNCDIIIGCRDVDHARKVVVQIFEKNDMDRVKIFHLDLASRQSIIQFASNVSDLNVSIHVLINNAGIMKSCPRRETADGDELHLGCNYLGHVLLTHLLHQRLQLAVKETGEAARIINVSSVTHTLCALLNGLQDLDLKSFYCPELAYSNSKTAIIVFSQLLQKKLIQSGDNIQVMTVHPGVVYTDLAVNSQETFRFTQVASKLMFKSADQAGETLLYAAFCPELETKNMDGLYLENSRLVDIGNYAKQPVLQQNLWMATKNKLKIENICCFI